MGLFTYNSLPMSKMSLQTINSLYSCLHLCVHARACVCVCVQTCLCVSAAVVRPSLVKRGKKKKACGARKSPASRPTSQSPSMMSAIAKTLLNSEQNIKYMIIIMTFSTVCEQLHMQKQRQDWTIQGVTRCLMSEVTKGYYAEKTFNSIKLCICKCTFCWFLQKLVIFYLYKVICQCTFRCASKLDYFFVV